MTINGVSRKKSKNVSLINFNTVLNLTAVVPEVTIDGAPQQFVVVGNDIQLTCHYNTSPSASEVRWKKDGVVISKNATIESGAQGSITHFNESLVQLTVNTSTPQDAGNYTCVVINSVDNSSHTASVVIQGLFSCFASLSKCAGSREFCRLQSISCRLLHIGLH